MSRRHRAETTDRLKRGDSHERNNANVTTVHVRSSVYFLNSDTSHGVTTLERAPSLNRLHAQSSTETSGLGETVTSGFSSQESVQSYHGDERDRIGVGSSFFDRSRRRGSSSHNVRVVDHEFIDRDEADSTQTAPHKHQLYRCSHHQHLTVPETLQWPDQQALESEQEVAERTNEDLIYLDSSQGSSGRRSKPVRDSGGRSLTPEEAKAEFEERHRRLEQLQKDRETSGNDVFLAGNNRPQGSTSNNVDKQRRPHLQHRSKASEDIHVAEFKERQTSVSSRDTRSSSCKLQRNKSNTEKHIAINVAVGSSRSKSKESLSNKLSRSKGTSRSQESIKASDIARQTADSKESVFYSEDNVYKSSRASSDGGSRERDKRLSSNANDVSKSQGSICRPNSNDYNESVSIKKGSQTGIFKSQSPEFRTQSETFQGSFKIQPYIVQNTRTVDESRRSLKYSSSDVKDCESKKCDSLEKYNDTHKVKRVSIQGVQKEHRKSFLDQHNSSNIRRDNNDNDYLFTSPHTVQWSDSTSVRTTARDTVIRERNRTSGNHNICDNLGGSNDDYKRRLQRFSDDNHAKVPDRRDIKVADTKRGNTTHFEIGDFDKYDLDLKSIRQIEATTDNDVRSNDNNLISSRNTGVNSLDFNQDTEIRSEFSNDFPAKYSHNVDSATLYTRSARSSGYLGIGRVDSRHDSVQRLPIVREDDTVPLYNADSVRTVRESKKEIMDYDRLFHQAGSGLNGVGGGGVSVASRGNRGYSVAFVEGYTTPSKRGGEEELFGPAPPGQSLIQPSTPSQGVAIKIIGANGESPSTKLKSTTHTTFQMPVTPLGSVPTVQLTSSPDAPGLNLAHIDKEWERRGSKCSNRSHNSRSSGKASNRFLGVNTGSAWTKWSTDRRASYRRRVEKLAKVEPAAQTTTIVRISTPVKKARQEGLKFMHPDLEASYLSEDDLKELRRHKQQQVQAMRVIERSRRNKFRLKTEVKMNSDQLHMLHEFWDHGLFVRARYLGVLVSLVAFIFMVISITNNSWVKHSEY